MQRKTKVENAVLVLLLTRLLSQFTNVNLNNHMIKTSKEIISDSIKEITEYQGGVIKPALTSFSHFNDNSLGGIYPGTIGVIAGISEMGKTHFLTQIESDFLNKELNPLAGEYCLLRCNWEMLAKDILISRIKSELGITHKDILFSKKYNNKINNVVQKEINENIYYHEESVSALQWYNEMTEFLEKHKDKKHILITLDHLALVSNEDQLKKAIDKLLNYANVLKKRFKNVSLLFISQLNREIEYRTDVRFLNPIRSDLYASDAIYHIADIIVVKHIPEYLGHEKYMSVQVSDYKHLKEFMFTPNLGHSSFRTKNLVFYHYLKIRKKEKGLHRIHVEYYDHTIIVNNIEQNEINIFA